jgi:hypothetical protein
MNTKNLANYCENDRLLRRQQAECLSILNRFLGSPAAVQHFLTICQPALEDRTGRELLQQAPAELLRRLRHAERGDT